MDNKKSRIGKESTLDELDENFAKIIKMKDEFKKQQEKLLISHDAIKQNINIKLRKQKEYAKKIKDILHKDRNSWVNNKDITWN